MIDAVMYGMMPRAKMVSLRMLPPANMSKNPKTVPDCELKNSCQRWMLMPGVGIWPPSRYTASIASVNSTRLRRSGTRKMLAKASKNLMVVCDSRRSSSRRADHLRFAAGLGDLVRSRFREVMRLDRDGPRQLARAQDFETGAELVDHAQLGQAVGSEHVAFQLIQPSQVDDGELLLEDVGEAALGQAAMQRHLAALETALLAEAADCLLALVPAPRGLARPRAHAAAHAFFQARLPGRGL